MLLRLIHRVRVPVSIAMHIGSVSVCVPTACVSVYWCVSVCVSMCVSRSMSVSVCLSTSVSV